MINNVVLVGRAGANPTIKTFNSGSKVAELNMALNRGSKDKQETDWFHVKFWDKQAEIAEAYIKKGHLFGVTGELQEEKWEKNGQEQRRVVVIGRTLKLMQPKDTGTPAPKKEEPADSFGSEDECPF